MDISRVDTSHIDRAIGPRVVGGLYLAEYWREEYTVLDIRVEGLWWEITVATDEELARGESRTHNTPWRERDAVISQPDAELTTPVAAWYRQPVAA